MRLYFKLLLVVIVLAAVVGIGFSPDRAFGAASVSRSASRNLYLSNCARCHGADGRADTESGRLYDVPDISRGRVRRKSVRRLTAIVSKGNGSMPAFGKKLSAKQIASLVAYVRGL